MGHFAFEDVDGTYAPYSDELNELLNLCNTGAGGEVKDYAIGRWKYTIKLETDGKHHQTNQTTGKRRRVVCLTHIFEVKIAGNWALASLQASYVMQRALVDSASQCTYKIGAKTWTADMDGETTTDGTTTHELRWFEELPMLHVKPIPTADAPKLIRELFGNAVAEQCIFPQARAYVSRAQRNNRDNDKIQWEGNLDDSVDRGQRHYFCPHGYMKVPLRMPGVNTNEEFIEATKGKPVCYHGTKKHFVASIVKTGLKGEPSEVHVPSGTVAVYTSPSVEYSSHPRYAQWFKHNGLYYQAIFQCRINYNTALIRNSESLALRIRSDVVIDPRFKNTDDLEWVIQVPDGQTHATKEQVLITGLLLRCSDDPFKMYQRHWWVIPYQITWKSKTTYTSDTVCWESHVQGLNYTFKTAGPSCKCAACSAKIALPAQRTL